MHNQLKQPLFFHLHILAMVFLIYLLNACMAPKSIDQLIAAGDKALQDSRLTAPEKNNAHYFYSQVLTISPKHPGALKGLKTIHKHYLKLGAKAKEQGNFSKAKQMLVLAESVHPATEESKKLHLEIYAAEEKSRKDSQEEGFKYRLSVADLDAKNQQIRKRLRLIGEHVATVKGTIIINARNFKESMWIYEKVQQAAGGFPVKETLSTGSAPHVIVFPKQE